MIPEGLGFMKKEASQFLGDVVVLFPAQHTHLQQLHISGPGPTVSCPGWDSSSTSLCPQQASLGIYVFMVFSLVFYLI